MIHLHLHSQYSTLDGLSKVKDIVAKAKELKAPAVAITDHASISCLPEFLKEANEAGINPIIGCEFYVVDSLEDLKGRKRYHLTVWAKSWAGVESIMAQLTLANRQFYYRPILTFDQALDFRECFVGTACAFGILSAEDWEAKATRLREVYGNDLMAEIMPHQVIMDDTDEQKKVNMRALKLHVDHGVNLLATNDSHYTCAEDAAVHNVLLATQYNRKLNEMESWPPVFFMRSMHEMATAFGELDYLQVEYMKTAMLQTIKLASQVKIEKPKMEITLPSIHEDDDRYLVDRCLAGWKRKIEGKVDYVDQYRKRLVYELEVIKKMGFVRYFNMVEDVIRWARANGIMVGPARGSSAGSLVCYLMDIVQVDPLRFGLYFERFLNPERVELPDIDVDFQDDRREEVFQYIVGKYGRDKVGQINTFTSMGVKGAFRDVCRLSGIDMRKINIMSQQIEDAESFDTVPDLANFARHHPEIVAITKKLDGTIRGNGVHACGVCISSRPLEAVCVMERRAGEVFVSNWDKRECEKFGLLKMDLLGLTNLTTFSIAAETIKKHYGVDIDFENPDLADQKTMANFARGLGSCVFQFESDGMQTLLKSINANAFETLAAATALYRPGPLNSGMTQQFVKIAKGEEYPYYPAPQLQPILEETHSIIVYQEQVMRIFHELAGFTWAHADQMRKIMGKKLGDDEFNKHRVDFVNGCVTNGTTEAMANTLFDQMKEFAQYGFNKSHSVAYTIISFWCMYLKTHYPAAYLAAFMSTARSDEAAMNGFKEARRLRIPVLPPDINSSTDRFEFDPDNKAILAPLGAVKGVGGKVVAAILEARKAGVFLSLEDFQERVVKRAVNKNKVEALVAAGAFESLGIKEQNKELRERQKAELLPSFDTVPDLNTIRAQDMNWVALEEIKAEIVRWASGNDPLFPVVGRTPILTIINGQVKGEKKLGTAKGVLPMLERLGCMGIMGPMIHYTTVVKLSLPKDPKTATKEAIRAGLVFLRKELEAVHPKLMYCCNADAVSMFAPGAKISKLYGTMKYSKEFDAFVLFGPSPQYANYRGAEVAELFDRCMNKIREMFDGDTDAMS